MTERKTPQQMLELNEEEAEMLKSLRRASQKRRTQREDDQEYGMFE
jgi:hypothetical protein